MTEPKPLAAGVVERLVAAAAVYRGRTSGSVTVSFVDAPTIHRLNRQHRGLDRPTDVLSFPYDGSFPHGEGGEVLVCTPVAAAQAAKLGRPVPDELAMLVVHGALHIYGMEDDTASGVAAMERAAQAILETAWSKTSE